MDGKPIEGWYLRKDMDNEKLENVKMEKCKNYKQFMKIYKNRKIIKLKNVKIKQINKELEIIYN